MQTSLSGRLLGVESFNVGSLSPTPDRSPSDGSPQSLSDALSSSLPASLFDGLIDHQASRASLPADAGSRLRLTPTLLRTPAGGPTAKDAALEADILHRAQIAGLDSDELARLKQILDTSPNFEADAALLDQALPDFVGSDRLANPDRALRTFMDLDELRRAHPDRITPEIVSSLVMGVDRSRGSFGLEGVIGQDAADRAARALIEMPQADYNAIQQALKQAGTGGSPYSDAGTERALILKAVAARENEYHPGGIDGDVPQPAMATQEIVDFAGAIRGMDRDQLLASTTVASKNDDVLTQRYFDSCVPTTLQMLKAEADPIYAMKLHQDHANASDVDGFIGNEQAELMVAYGYTPIPFGEMQALQQWANSGNPLIAGIAKKMFDSLKTKGADLENMANGFDSSTTGRDYHESRLGDDATSRTQAVDHIAMLCREGVDVPIGVAWEAEGPDVVSLTAEASLSGLAAGIVDTGAGHALLVTDVRGEGENTRFIISDPATGSTYEVERSDLIKGNTQFGNDGKGRLSQFLW